MRDDRERGSATPLLALLVVAVGGLCLGLGRMGGVANAKAAAQTAADAAALAAAVDGEGAARAYAAANGAELESVSIDGDEAQVLVRLGEVTAAARAEADGGGDGGGRRGAAAATGLVPELQASLRRAAELLGVESVPITSGWRSYERQQALYDSRGTNPYPVARPGTSSHERGRAVDVPRSFADRLAAVGPRAGLCRPWPESDPVHFELCRRTP